MYKVIVLAQVGYSNYESSEYGAYSDSEQAYDVCGELSAQGLNAWVEQED